MVCPLEDNKKHFNSSYKALNLMDYIKVKNRESSNLNKCRLLQMSVTNVQYYGLQSMVNFSPVWKLKKEKKTAYIMSINNDPGSCHCD